jgi:hypothetical protein
MTQTTNCATKKPVAPVGSSCAKARVIEKSK